MYPHPIRLRGPWECEPLPQSGRVRWRRRFGYPGQIDAHERVWLTGTGLQGDAVVRLNGELLNGGAAVAGSFEFEITRLLKVRNELTLEMDGTGDRGETALEVRCTAYLRGVRAWTEAGRLHVSGELIGTCERPLDLYVLCGRSTVAYTTLEALPEGRPFQVMAEVAPEESAEVRVELVNGAVVWYAATV